MTRIALATHLDRFVRRLHVRLSTRAKDFDPDRVGPGGAMLLLTLAETGAAPLSKLAAQLVRDKSQLTREVASLERKGMVTRQLSDQDARVQLLSLTPKGDTLVALHKQAVADILDDMMIGLSEPDKATLETLLRAVTP